MKKYLFLTTLVALVPKVASAHCPLCVAGAGALAALAASLGVSSVVVGVLIGAFAVALGLWFAGFLKKQYIPQQKPILAFVIFLSTVIPIQPLIVHYAPFYVPFFGEYGTTYTINLYVLGVIIGSIIMLFSPYVSKWITRLRGEQLPYQGITITMTLLVVVSIIIQIV